MKTTIEINGMEIPCDLQVNPNLIPAPCQPGMLPLPWPAGRILTHTTCLLMSGAGILPEPILGRMEVRPAMLRGYTVYINAHPAAWGLQPDGSHDLNAFEALDAATDLARGVAHAIENHDLHQANYLGDYITVEVITERPSIHPQNPHPGQPYVIRMAGGPSNQFVVGALTDIARRYYLTSRGMDAQPTACPNCGGPFGGE